MLPRWGVFAELDDYRVVGLRVLTITLAVAISGLGCRTGCGLRSLRSWMFLFII
jgi:hypothetical protein